MYLYYFTYLHRNLFIFRGDGRGWLPLHWAAVLHDTSEDDLEFITREKPAACIQGHMSSVGVIRTQGTICY